MSWPPKKPLLLVVSAPSGAGKTTLCERLRKRFPQLRYSVSVTTRSPRDGEVHGAHYHFVSEADFLAEVAAGGFLEHARVHDHWYGTRIETVQRLFDDGYDVLMDVDVQGASLIREAFARDALAPARLVDVFISPPSIDVLEQRLRQRGQDEDAVIRRRIQNAEEELSAREAYTYGITNDQLEHAAEALESIVLAEHFRL